MSESADTYDGGGEPPSTLSIFSSFGAWYVNAHPKSPPCAVSVSLVRVDRLGTVTPGEFSYSSSKITTLSSNATDTHGDTMHTVKRELFKGDEWQHNHTKGDMLRIRDMFRVDKLNKISAYESLALIPGIYAPSLFQEAPDGSLQPRFPGLPRPSRRIVADFAW